MTPSRAASCRVPSPSIAYCRMNVFNAQVEEEALRKLLTQKKEVLEKQKAVSDEFHRLLTTKGEDNLDNDGAIENSRKIMKNLEVAIVASRQPGYFR